MYEAIICFTLNILLFLFLLRFFYRSQKGYDSKNIDDELPDEQDEEEEKEEEIEAAVREAFGRPGEEEEEVEAEEEEGEGEGKGKKKTRGSKRDINFVFGDVTRPTAPPSGPQIIVHVLDDSGE